MTTEEPNNIEKSPFDCSENTKNEHFFCDEPIQDFFNPFYHDNMEGIKNDNNDYSAPNLLNIPSTYTSYNNNYEPQQIYGLNYSEQGQGYLDYQSNFISDSSHSQSNNAQNFEFSQSNSYPSIDKRQRNNLTDGSSLDILSENSTNQHTPILTQICGGHDETNEEESSNQAQQAIGRLKKNIMKKKYEPLFDNNEVYIYEQNPQEYKKARKQSARKVRSIKKNITENLESNVEFLQQDNQNLKMQVADLSAQNQRLRDEVHYFRSIFLSKQIPESGHKVYDMHEIGNYNKYRNPQQSTMNENNLTETNVSSKININTLPYTTVRTDSKRLSANNQLFMVALISCIVVMTYSNSSSDLSYHQNVVLQFQKQISTHKLEIKVPENISSSFKFLLEETRHFEALKTIFWILLFTLNLLYLAYTLYTSFFIKFFNKNKCKSS